jgi:hypothetical protein
MNQSQLNYGKGKSQGRPIIIRDEEGAIIYGYKAVAWLREEMKKLSKEELKKPAPIIDVRPVAKEIYLAFMYLKYKDRDVVKRLYPPDPRDLRPSTALLQALSNEITLTEADVYELLRMQAKFVADRRDKGESIEKWIPVD